MVDRVEVDPDQLERASVVTQELSDSVQGVGDRLRSRLEGLEDESNGQPWGDDTFGSKFVNGEDNNGYGTSKPNLLDGVDGISGTFNSFAVGQRDAVNELRSMDEQF
ncbi:hypothetical protein [Nocardia jinanensis]|uniref:WXG100 family type VII secretion target n=1 Tax=Nocardia jinanensis TaxID=382504 RepID=A0A917VYB4_9NOCA|nr:hypothetical protein [Nocardia jinanensis]GGL36209.1 hypothetical protein GCM10011588_58800 [Nocardia jinanensis]